MNILCTKDSRFELDMNSSYILKIISEPNRLKILCILSKLDICVCDIAKKMEVSHNLISFHLKILYEVGILNKKRTGNKIFYCISKEWRPRIKHLFKFIDTK